MNSKKIILTLVSVLFFSQSICFAADVKEFRETGELRSFRAVKEIVEVYENKPPYGVNDYKNALNVIKNFEQLESTSYKKKYKERERTNIYEIIRILLCDHKGSVVLGDNRDGSRLEINTPLLYAKTRNGSHQKLNILASDGKSLQNFFINPFKVQACEKKIKTLLPDAYISYGEVDFKSAIKRDNPIIMGNNDIRSSTDNTVYHAPDLTGCSVITLHVPCIHSSCTHSMNPPCAHLGIMAHLSPASQSEANESIQKIIHWASQESGVNLADLKPTVSIISGHISDYILNYCNALKNAALTPQYVYHGLSVYEFMGPKSWQGKILNQGNFYYYAGLHEGSEIVTDGLEGTLNSLYYPRAVTFDVQSGEISTIAIKDKNAKKKWG